MQYRTQLSGQTPTHFDLYLRDVTSYSEAPDPDGRIWSPGPAIGSVPEVFESLARRFGPCRCGKPETGLVHSFPIESVSDVQRALRSQTAMRR